MTPEGGDDHLCFKDDSSERLGELSKAVQLQRRAELGVRSHWLKAQTAHRWEEGRTGPEGRRRSWGAPLISETKEPDIVGQRAGGTCYLF